MPSSVLRRVPAAAAAGVVALVLASCSSPGGTDPAPSTSGTASGDLCADGPAAQLVDSLDGMSADERETTLAEQAAATRGGAIDWYTEINDPQPFVDAFEDTYDGVTVNVYRAGSDQIRQRIIEESAANFAGADLVEMDSLEMATLDQEGLLTKASSSHLDELSEAAKGFEHFIGDRFSYILPVWNTTLLAPEDVPKSFEDLADPRFKGKLAVESSDVLWFAGLVLHMEEEDGMTEDEAVEVFRKVVANATMTSGHTTTAELVVAGQYAINANGYVHRALILKDENAPVEFAPINVPIVPEITAVGMLCLSDNPAGALLLQDFILSPEGQQIFVDDHRTPANEEMAQQTLGGIDADPIPVDVIAVARDYTKWSDLWNDVVREGSQG